MDGQRVLRLILFSELDNLVASVENLHNKFIAYNVANLNAEFDCVEKELHAARMKLSGVDEKVE